GCHPVADADTEFLGQRVGERGHACSDFLEGRDLRLGSQVRGHRAVAVRVGTVGQDLRYGKGAFLHRRFHAVHLSPRLGVPFLYDAISSPTRRLGGYWCTLAIGKRDSSRRLQVCELAPGVTLAAASRAPCEQPGPKKDSMVGGV